MKITFLGTGGLWGVPAWNCNCKVCESKNPKDKRMRSSILITIGDKNIVIDFGPDFRSQLIKYEIKNVDYALITHAHTDHINGYSELGMDKDLLITAPKQVINNFIEKISPLPFWLKGNKSSEKIIPFNKKNIGGVEIDSVELDHRSEGGNKKIHCFGYVFRSKEFSFAYITDYTRIIEKDKLKELDLIISEGSSLEAKNLFGHVGIKGSTKIFNELKPKKMLLTHLTHEKSHDFLNNYLKKFGDIKCAYDGMEITI